jgi:hypothetical protein
MNSVPFELVDFVKALHTGTFLSLLAVLYLFARALEWRPRQPRATDPPPPPRVAPDDEARDPPWRFERWQLLHEWPPSLHRSTVLLLALGLVIGADLYTYAELTWGYWAHPGTDLGTSPLSLTARLARPIAYLTGAAMVIAVAHRDLYGGMRVFVAWSLVMALAITALAAVGVPPRFMLGLYG